MKTTTEKGFRQKIRQSCKGVGTYKPEFESLIGRLASVYVRMNECQEEFQKSGGRILVGHTTKSGGKVFSKNPLLIEQKKKKKTALDMERDLGLTPAALKRINEAAMASQADEDPLTAALSQLRVV